MAVFSHAVDYVDAGDPWGGGRMPPLGRLREPLSGIARADAVLVTKTPRDPEPILTEVQRVVADHAVRSCSWQSKIPRQHDLADGKKPGFCPGL